MRPGKEGAAKVAWVRPARAEDAEAVAAIHNAVIAMIDPVVTFTTQPRPVDPAQFERRPHWVALQDGQVAGFATFGAFRAGPGYAATAEHSLHLAPGARGLGLGRALMSHLQAYLIKGGYRVLVAGIGAENQNAVEFHMHMGFAETGRMPDVGHKAGRSQTLVLMQKTLSAPGIAR